LSLVLVVLAQPLGNLLRRHGWPAWAAALTCILAAYTVVLGLVVAVVLSLGRLVSLLPGYQDEFQDLVQDVVSGLEQLGLGDQPAELVKSSADFDTILNVLTSILSSATSLASNLFLILTLIIFLTVDAVKFTDLLDRSGRRAWVNGLNTFASATRQYFAVSTIFGLIVAVLDTIALAILGIPAAVVWGLLAFLTNYIPNIGFVIGLIPPTVLALLEGGPGLAITVIAVYSVINAIIQSIIQPKFVGDAVGLSTTLTFVSLMFWAFVLGPMGALLAVPLSLFVRGLLVDSDPGRHWLVPLIANKDEDELDDRAPPSS
jgi:AI-2 transport protein TqsA